MRIKCSKNCNFIPSINKNGEKFYIVLNGTPTAVKLIDTYLTPNGSVKGEFLLATGEKYEGKLEPDYMGISYPYSTNGKITRFTIKDEDNKLTFVAYSNLEDLKIGKTIGFDYLEHIDVYGPWSKLMKEENYDHNWFITGHFFVADTRRGTIKESECGSKYDKLVFDKVLGWCFSKDGHSPMTSFRTDIFSNYTSAENYYKTELSKKKVVDFEDDVIEEKSESVSFVSRVKGETEDIPEELVGQILKMVYGR